MKIGNLTKAALVVALMMGQVTPPDGNSGYYEDDGDFNTVSSILRGGWGWSLNKAHADCYDISDYSAAQACMEASAAAWEPDYTGGVTAPYPDDSWAFPDDPFENSDYGYGDQDSGNGGGGGGSGEPVPEPPTAEQRIAECKSNIDTEISNCKNTYFYYVSGAGILCSRITWGIGASFCGASASGLIYEAHKWCDAQGDAKKARDCK